MMILRFSSSCEAGAVTYRQSCILQPEKASKNTTFLVYIQTLCLFVYKKFSLKSPLFPIKMGKNPDLGQPKRRKEKLHTSFVIDPLGLPHKLGHVRNQLMTMAQLSLQGNYNEVYGGKKALRNKSHVFAWSCQECQSHPPGSVLGGSLKGQTRNQNKNYGSVGFLTPVPHSKTHRKTHTSRM